MLWKMRGDPGMTVCRECGVPMQDRNTEPFSRDWVAQPKTARSGYRVVKWVVFLGWMLIAFALGKLL